MGDKQVGFKVSTQLQASVIVRRGHCPIRTKYIFRRSRQFGNYVITLLQCYPILWIQYCPGCKGAREDVGRYLVAFSRLYFL